MPIREQYDLILIGGGIAAHAAAIAYRRQNPHGRMAMITAESLPLYSPCALPYMLSGHMTETQIFLKHPFSDRKWGVDRLAGIRAAAIDPVDRAVSLEGTDNRLLGYQNLVLATGSRPIRPSCLGLELEGLFTLKTFADAKGLKDHIGRRAVVVGSGLIGVEAAIALTHRGWNVSLIEAQCWVMPTLLDREGAERVEVLLAQRGIEVLTGHCVEAVCGDGQVRGVTTSCGDRQADVVVLAVGMNPNVDLARAAGLTIGPTGGVVVDSAMKTSDPHIYACGDCVESRDYLFNRPVLNLFWHVAKAQGKTAGTNAGGGRDNYRPEPKMASTSIFGVPVYSIGSTANELICLNRSPEIKVKKMHKRFWQTIWLGNNLVGIQMINQTRGLSFFNPAVHLGLKRNELERLLKKRFNMSPHLCRLAAFGPAEP